MPLQGRSAMPPDDDPGQHLRRYRGPFLAPMYSASRMGMLTLLAEPIRTQRYLLDTFNLGGPWPAVYPSPFEDHYDYWSPDTVLDRHGTLREYEFTRYAQLYRCENPFPLHRALIRTDSIFHIPFLVERDTTATIHNATETCRIKAHYFVRLASLSYSLWEAVTRIMKIYKVLQLVPFDGLDVTHTFGSKWRELLARFTYPLPVLDLVRIDAELRRRLADALSWVEFQTLALVWSLAFWERVRPPRFPTLQDRVGLIVEGGDHVGYAFGLELARDLGIPVWNCRPEGRSELSLPGRGDAYADRARGEVLKRGIREEDVTYFESAVRSEYSRLIQVAEDRGLSRPPREIPVLANEERFAGPGKYFRATPPGSVFEKGEIPQLLSLIGVVETVLNKNRIPPHRPVIIGAEQLRGELYEALRAYLGPDILSGTRRTKDELPDLPLWAKANSEALLHGDPHILEGDQFLPKLLILPWKPDSDYDQLLLCRAPRPAEFAGLQQVVNEAPDAYAFLDSRFRLALKTPGRAGHAGPNEPVVPPFRVATVRRSSDRSYKASRVRNYSLPRQPLQIEETDPLADSNRDIPFFQKSFNPNSELVRNSSMSSLDLKSPSSAVNTLFAPPADPFTEVAATIVARLPVPLEDLELPAPSSNAEVSPLVGPTPPSDDFPDPSRLSLEAVLAPPRRPSESPPTRNVRARLRSPSPPREYIDLTGSPDSPESLRVRVRAASFLSPFPEAPVTTVSSPRFVQAVKNDDMWFSKTFEAAWPSKVKGKPDPESPGFLLQWGEVSLSSEIGRLFLRSFDTANCCLRDDDFFEFLCHRFPGLWGASLYFLTDSNDKSLRSFSVTLGFEERHSAIVVFRGLARAFSRFPDSYPPITIIAREEVDRIPEGIREKLEKRKKVFDTEREGLALRYTKGARKLEIGWTRRMLGEFENWVDLLPSNFRPWIHSDQSQRAQGEYPRDGMPRWLTEAPSWPMTRYSFSPDEFDVALGYASRVLAAADPSQTNESQICVRTIREHYAYTSTSVPAGLSVKLSLPLPPLHGLRQLLLFLATHASRVLLLEPLLATDEFHRVELFSYSYSRGTYEIILADRDNSLGYWDFVERKMDDFIEK